jgi:hypothetical protein
MVYIIYFYFISFQQYQNKIVKKLHFIYMNELAIAP